MIRKLPIAIVLLLAGVSTSVGYSAEWADYGATFPKFPCHDGWMACLVDGEAVNPNVARDAENNPVASDLRIGWFDLQPTRSFSPFVELSAYTGELPGGEVAAAEIEEPEEEYVDPAAEAAREESARAQAEQRARAEEAKRAREEAAAAGAAKDAAAAKAKEEKRRAKEAAAAAANAKDEAERKRLQKEAEEARARAAEEERKRKAAEEAERQRKAEAERKRKEEEAARLAAQKAEEERKRREAEEARKREEERKRREAEEKKRKEAEAAAAAAAAAAAENDAVAMNAAGAAAADESCDNLVRLEPSAMLGKLNQGQAACLESSLSTAAKQTDKEKISRILMANAYSKGDKMTWEKLVKRHLDEINQSDPDLCYKYALHLSRKGPGKAYGVIRWADVALENRTVWTGDTYTSRVYSLYKLKAASAQKLWKKAEEGHAASPSAETKKKVDDARNMTKVNAREWYEYAKVAGKDTTKALQLCMSAAGTKDYCEAG